MFSIMGFFQEINIEEKAHRNSIRIDNFKALFNEIQDSSIDEYLEDDIDQEDLIKMGIERYGREFLNFFLKELIKPANDLSKIKFNSSNYENLILIFIIFYIFSL